MATPLTPTAFVAALTSEGVKVREYDGWRGHNRNHKGAWGPVNGILIHHTAGADSLHFVYTGSSALPGPLCHTHLAKSGTATMVGNGRSNHAGPVAGNVHAQVLAETKSRPEPSRASGTVDGNRHYYGIEIENLGTGKDPYPAVQYDAAVRWAAALCRAHGWSAQSVAGHKETSVEGKIDPSFSMSRFRADVADRLKHKPSWNPEGEDDMPSPEDIYKAVWRRDNVPAPSTVSTADTNPTWHAESYLPEIVDRINRLTDKVDALSATVERLAAPRVPQQHTPSQEV